LFGHPAGFGPLLGGIGAGRPPPLFPPLDLLIFFSFCGVYISADL